MCPHMAVLLNLLWTGRSRLGCREVLVQLSFHLSYSF